MPRRSPISLADVAAGDNLALAFWRSAKGKRARPEVIEFAANLDVELARLRQQILAAELPEGAMDVFEIRDPKPRIIHAPCFRQRVLHHALMALLGPVIERSLVADSFACIKDRGTLAAVLRAQTHARRRPWYVKIDIAAYFASIEHARLLDDLRRRFKNAGVLRLCERILAQHHTTPGRGLPIGALTSQHFANLYLGPLDRFLLETLRVGAMVRYMDDTLWWGRSVGEVRRQLGQTIEFVERERGLTVKPNWQINRCTRGIPFCGFRVFPHALRLSQRRRRRYRLARSGWESAYRTGSIDAFQLQRGYASALAITLHADAHEWRRQQLAGRPPPDA